MQWSPQQYLHPTQALLFRQNLEQTNQKQSVRAWTPLTLKPYPQVRFPLRADFTTSRHFGTLNWVLSFVGALKTDHTEVLLSADFTGAIKVFINVKKYWALQRLSAPHTQADCRRSLLKTKESLSGAFWRHPLPNLCHRLSLCDKEPSVAFFRENMDPNIEGNKWRK